MFERELQEALQLSMSQSDGSQESSTSTPADAHSNNQPPILINDDDRAPSPILPPLGKLLCIQKKGSDLGP